MNRLSGHSRIACLAGLFLMQSVAACTVAVTGVGLPASETLAVGASLQLTPAISPTNATNLDVNWDSSNPVAATVSGTGVVTGIAAGTTTVTCTTIDGGFTASTDFTVIVPVTGVSLGTPPVTLQMVLGTTSQLTAILAPADATDQNLSWTSSNTGVATVSSSGLVTAVVPGTATITATTEDGSFTATCDVTVAAAGTVNGTVTGPNGPVSIATVLEGDSIAYNGTSCAGGSDQISDYVITLSDHSGVCTGLQSDSGIDSSSNLFLVITGSGPTAGSAAPTIPPNTYTLGNPLTDANGNIFAAAAQLILYDASCTHNTASATAGSITISTILGSGSDVMLTGTYTVTFGSAGTFTGTFGAPSCDLTAIQFCAATSGPLTTCN